MFRTIFVMLGFSIFGVLVAIVGLGAAADESQPPPPSHPASIDFTTSPVAPALSFHAKPGAWTCATAQAALEMPVQAALFAHIAGDPPPQSEYRRLIDSGVCLPIDPTVAFAVRARYRIGDMSDAEEVAVGEMKDINSDGAHQFWIANNAIEPATSHPASWRPDPRYLPTMPHYSMPSAGR